MQYMHVWLGWALLAAVESMQLHKPEHLSQLNIGAQHIISSNLALCMSKHCSGRGTALPLRIRNIHLGNGKGRDRLLGRAHGRRRQLLLTAEASPTGLCLLLTPAVQASGCAAVLKKVSACCPRQPCKAQKRAIPNIEQRRCRAVWEPPHTVPCLSPKEKAVLPGYCTYVCMLVAHGGPKA